MMYQKVVVVGNLGTDPEMRFMPDGTPVTNFSVATNRRWNNEQGEKVEEVCWFRCSAWRKTAELIDEYFEKGKPILVEGRMKPDPQTGGPKIFTRQDGTAGASYELTVERFSFLPGGDPDGGGSAGGYGGTRAPQEEDEIPF